MTYDELIKQPNSHKLTLVEIDAPLIITSWINYSPGLWFSRITNTTTVVDDYGVEGYYEGESQYYNIQSLNVDGELYTEVANLTELHDTNKSWYYDTSTTDFYIHLDNWQIPEFFTFIYPGAVIGFSFGRDGNNYFEDIYYEDLLLSIPSLKKSKDPLFFGILKYEGGSITFDNTSGYFDDFAKRDLYGQPVRILLGFAGITYSEYQPLYSGRVEDFSHNLTEFTLNVADQRKLLSRSLPINVFDSATYPDMDVKYFGTPIPIAYGQVIKSPAYKVTDTGSVETWVFCDTSINAVTSGVTVYDKDGNTVTHTGTGVDGTFTSSSTEKTLYVTFSVPITNGLEIIEDILENYEGVAYNASNYNTSEWEAVKPNIENSGIWIGKGNQKTTADIIEQICVDNNGLFEVMNDGRYTFRVYDSERASEVEILQDELLNDPDITYEAEEYLSSVKVNYSLDYLEKEYVEYNNDSQEAEIYGRYRQYKEQSFDTSLSSEASAISLSNKILERSNYIYPKVSLVTKTQNAELRILDIVTFTTMRQNGKIIIGRSRWEVIGVTLNLTAYEVEILMRQIEEIGDTEQKVIDLAVLPDQDQKLLPNGQAKQTITRI